tara:strand:+ start:208 stop:567 length:360 start_codon:yes stop_codon:yes gene_type:complete
MFNLKPFQLSFINSLTLILLGAYGYFQSSTPSMTALIPVIFGILLLAMNSGVKKQNKIIAHIAVTVTLLMIIGLIMPLLGSIDRSDNAAIFRIIVMMVTSIFAMISFIKSFIAARKEAE